MAGHIQALITTPTPLPPLATPKKKEGENEGFIQANSPRGHQILADVEGVAELRGCSGPPLPSVSLQLMGVPYQPCEVSAVGRGMSFIPITCVI